MLKGILQNKKNSDRIAVIESGREISYADLFVKARAVRLNLLNLPLRQRERIAILLPNGGNYISALFALFSADIVAFPLNVLMTGYEISKLLRQASVSTVITSTAYAHMFSKSKINELDIKIILIDELQTAECELQTAECELQTAECELQAAECELQAAECEIMSVECENEYDVNDADTDKPIILLNTSGTTGNSKIVQLSERNICTAVLGYLDKVNYDEIGFGNVKYILAAPFSSVYGNMIITACLLSSFPIIVLGGAFTLTNIFRTAEKYKATHYEGSGTMILLMEQMIGRQIPFDIASLKYFGFGGSKISGQTINNVMANYDGVRLYQGYGMTESSPLITKHPQIYPIKAESVGTAIKGVKLAVATEGEKITDAPFAVGEVIMQGTNVMLGYLDNKAETELAIKNGYLYTGDIGYLDDEGYLFLLGRKKNIIIVRGFNVYPEEVEECILAAELASDCCVYGQTNLSGDEIVIADIVPSHPNVREWEIRKYLAAHIAEYKIPRKINFVNAIDKNLSGKTQRK